MESQVPESVEDAPLDVRGMYPGLWWNENRYEARQNRVKQLESEIGDADAIGVVDSDADGLACEVVLRDRFDNPTVIIAGSSDYGIYLSQALRLVSENANSDTPVFVADLSPDSTFSSFQASLASIDSPVTVCDHHNWSWNALTSVETVVEQVIVEDGMCAAQILQQSIHPNADDSLVEFLEVTADHDLWRKEDERSDHLSTLSFRLPKDEYVENALEYGADMIAQSDELRQLYEESEREANERAQRAVENADWFEATDYTVAVTYFDCHQSRTGEKLIRDGADLAVIIQPTLSVSFRSTEEFGRCAELARSLGGGGHKDSAGASLYDHINQDITYSAEQLESEHFNETADDLDIENMTKHEFVWRTDGEPAIQFMKKHVLAELTG